MCLNLSLNFTQERLRPSELTEMARLIGTEMIDTIEVSPSKMICFADGGAFQITLIDVSVTKLCLSCTRTWDRSLRTSSRSTTTSVKRGCKKRRTRKMPLQRWWTRRWPNRSFLRPKTQASLTKSLPCSSVTCTRKQLRLVLKKTLWFLKRTKKNARFTSPCVLLCQDLRALSQVVLMPT